VTSELDLRPDYDGAASSHGLQFGALAELAHHELRTRDLDRLVEYYRDVIGLTITARDTDTVALGAAGRPACVTLKRAAEGGLGRLGFRLGGDLECGDAETILRRAGIAVERRSDALAGIPELLHLADPEGNTIELYGPELTGLAPVSAAGIRPHKLGHVCVRAADVQGLCDWYERTLGFRWSDWIADFFVFIRLGPDHHSLNLLKGEQTGNVLHHVAYELRDFAHVQEACDHLARHGFSLMWGPGRHGPGHNIFTYHGDPDGNVVELFCQLDVMNDALGAFEPRPWHRDSPQRPKRWVPEPLVPNSWGIAPPDAFL
jgi:catechol-2,3-dioxygenase